MKNNQAQPVMNKSQIRLIEADAYGRGYENVPIDDSLAETAADFAAKQEKVRRESADAVKRLEGETAVAKHRLDDADESRKMWHDATNGVVPPVAAPFGKIVAAFAAMAGEAVLLAPLMDLFGVKDENFQYVLAGVIVVVLALLVELPIYLWRKEFNRYAAAAVGAVIGLGLISLGIFRAFGLQAIEAKKSALISGFLDENSLLSAIVIAFLTAGLPVGAAFAFETGWHGLSRWQQWKRSRRDALRFAKLHKLTIKKLEGEIEKRDKFIAEIEETKESWLAAMRQAHKEGLLSKQRRKPFWEIAPLLFGGCLLILAAETAFAYIFCDTSLSEFIESDSGRFTLYFGFALGLMSLFAFYVVKRWRSPNTAQFYADRPIVWRGDAEARQPKLIETAPVGNLKTTEKVPPKFAESVKANGKFA